MLILKMEKDILPHTEKSNENDLDLNVRHKALTLPEENM